MTIIKRWTTALMICVFTLTTPSAAMAQEETLGDYFHGIGTKFARGLGHILSSPADIPCTMAFEMRESPGTGFFTGLGKGTLFMLRRLLVGVTEVGTFIIPAERTIPPVCRTTV